jgi:hypothetical protein
LKDAFTDDWAQVLERTFDEAVRSRLKAENAPHSRNAYVSSIALVRNPKANGGDGFRGIAVLTPCMKSSGLLVADTGNYADAASPSIQYLSFTADVKTDV